MEVPVLERKRGRSSWISATVDNERLVRGVDRLTGRRAGRYWACWQSCLRNKAEAAYAAAVGHKKINERRLCGGLPESLNSQESP